MSNKRCTKCKESKPLTDFYKRDKGTSSHCKICIRTKTGEYHRINRESILPKMREYGVKNYNPKLEKIRKAKQYNDYKHTGRWYEARGRRRAAELNAVPKWLTTEQLLKNKEIYKNCPDGYEVDHIIPLQNKKVCGLHVPWNLQYLTTHANRSKGNKLLIKG